MGHGASSAAVCNVDTLFVSQELRTGIKALKEGAEFRKAFISYVKGGSWLESVRRLVPTLSKGLSHDQRLALEKGSPLYEYKRAESADGWYEEVMSSEGQTISKKLSMSAGNSIRGAPGSAKERFILVSGRDEQDAFGECYARLEDCACFTPTELVSLMLNAVYPLYLASPDYLRFLKYGCEWGDEESSVASASVVSGVSLTANEAAAKHLKRAQEILLSTAAYFDESQLLELLQCPRWEEELTHALQVHRLPISIVDLSEASRPFVYENRAFLRMTGYSDDQIHLKPWSMLAGANTEASQTALLEGAWKAQEPCKVVHTHYNRKQQPFQDFVASRPIGKYAVNVHFQVYKGCDLEPLKMVDDLLLLVTCAIKQPPPPTRTRFFSSHRIPSSSSLGSHHSPALTGRKAMTGSPSITQVKRLSVATVEPFESPVATGALVRAVSQSRVAPSPRAVPSPRAAASPRLGSKLAPSPRSLRRAAASPRHSLRLRANSASLSALATPGIAEVETAAETETEEVSDA